MHFLTFDALAGDVKGLREELAKLNKKDIWVVDSYEHLGKETKISPDPIKKK